MTNHTCNAHCRDGNHCDLVYAPPEWLPVVTSQMTGQGRAVSHVRETTEAPDWEHRPDGAIGMTSTDMTTGETTPIPSDSTWLVFWEVTA